MDVLINLKLVLAGVIVADVLGRVGMLLGLQPRGLVMKLHDTVILY